MGRSVDAISAARTVQDSDTARLSPKAKSGGKLNTVTLPLPHSLGTHGFLLSYWTSAHTHTPGTCWAQGGAGGVHTQVPGG